MTAPSIAAALARVADNAAGLSLIARSIMNVTYGDDALPAPTPAFDKQPASGRGRGRWVMSDPFSKFANGDGTYNGVKMLAEVSGLSEAEVSWTFNRLKHLTQVDGHHQAYAKEIVKAEARMKPWLVQQKEPPANG